MVGQDLELLAVLLLGLEEPAFVAHTAKAFGVHGEGRRNAIRILKNESTLKLGIKNKRLTAG